MAKSTKTKKAAAPKEKAAPDFSKPGDHWDETELKLNILIEDKKTPGLARNSAKNLMVRFNDGERSVPLKDAADAIFKSVS